MFMPEPALSWRPGDGRAEACERNDDLFATLDEVGGALAPAIARGDPLLMAVLHLGDVVSRVDLRGKGYREASERIISATEPCYRVATTLVPFCAKRTKRTSSTRA